MKKVFLWSLAVIMVITMVAAFSLSGCNTTTTTETAAAATTAAATTAAATQQRRLQQRRLQQRQQHYLWVLVTIRKQLRRFSLMPVIKM